MQANRFTNKYACEERKPKDCVDTSLTNAMQVHNNWNEKNKNQNHNLKDTEIAIRDVIDDGCFCILCLIALTILLLFIQHIECILIICMIQIKRNSLVQHLLHMTHVARLFRNAFAWPECTNFQIVRTLLCFS